MFILLFYYLLEFILKVKINFVKIILGPTNLILYVKDNLIMSQNNNYRDNFNKLICNLNERLEKLNARKHSYKEEKENQVILISHYSVTEEMVEHIKIMSGILVPEWVENISALNKYHPEIANSQFKKYYTLKNKKIPSNMWQTPLVLKFNYYESNYVIGQKEEITTKVSKFISKQEALDKFRNYQKEDFKLNQIIKETLKKYDKRI